MIVKEYIGKYGTLRQFANDLFKAIDTSSENEIELDFTDVTFCGRGLSQEFISRIKKSNKTFIIINQCEDVKQMFYAVEHPHPKVKF